MSLNILSHTEDPTRCSYYDCDRESMSRRGGCARTRMGRKRFLDFVIFLILCFYCVRMRISIKYGFLHSLGYFLSWKGGSRSGSKTSQSATSHAQKVAILICLKDSSGFVNRRSWVQIPPSALISPILGLLHRTRPFGHFFCLRLTRIASAAFVRP